MLNMNGNVTTDVCDYAALVGTGQLSIIMAPISLCVHSSSLSVQRMLGRLFD